MQKVKNVRIIWDSVWHGWYLRYDVYDQRDIDSCRFMPLLKRVSDNELIMAAQKEAEYCNIEFPDPSEIEIKKGHCAAKPLNKGERP